MSETTQAPSAIWNLSAAAQSEAREILADFPNKKSALLMILRLVERERGCLDDAGMEKVAELCEVAPAHVLGMVTFYTHFKRSFHGKHRLMVCATLMCDLGGAQETIARIGEVLGIRPGERTADGLFSLEKVECLADCDRPPVLQVDTAHHVRARGAELDRLLEALLAQEGKTSAEYRGRAGVRMDAHIPYVPVKHSL